MKNQTEIVQPILEHFGFTLDQIREKNRSGSLPACRQFCMAALRANTTMKLKEIAGFVGLSDHSTVLYGIEVVEKMIMFGPKRQREQLSQLYKLYVAER